MSIEKDQSSVHEASPLLDESQNGPRTNVDMPKEKRGVSFADKIKMRASDDGILEITMKDENSNWNFAKIRIDDCSLGEGVEMRKMWKMLNSNDDQIKNLDCGLHNLKEAYRSDSSEVNNMNEKLELMQRTVTHISAIISSDKLSSEVSRFKEAYNEEVGLMNDKLDRINPKIDYIDKKSAENHEIIDEVDNNVIELTEKVEELKKDLEKQRADIEDIAKTVVENEVHSTEKLNELGQRMNNVHSSSYDVFSSLDERVCNLELSRDSILSRVNTLDDDTQKQFDDVETHFDDLETRVGDAKDVQRQMDEKMSEQGNEIAILKDLVNTMQKRMDEMETRSKAFGDSHQAAVERVEKRFSTSLELLSSGVQTLERRIDTNFEEDQGCAVATENKIDSLKFNINRLDGVVYDQEREIKGKADKVYVDNGLLELTGSLTNKISEISTFFDGINQRILSDLKENEDGVQDVKERLEILTESVKEDLAELRAFNEKVILVED